LETHNSGSHLIQRVCDLHNWWSCGSSVQAMLGCRFKLPNY
jgi:hypothetical protein